MVSQFLMIFWLGGKQSYDYSVCMGLDSTVNFCNYNMFDISRRGLVGNKYIFLLK